MDAPTENGFDWRQWEHDIQGVEFDLPSSLFQKSYQSDDIVAPIIGSYSGSSVTTTFIDVITKGGQYWVRTTDAVGSDRLLLGSSVTYPRW